MLNLLFFVVLIPLFGIYCWFMGYKTAKKGHDRLTNNFNVKYAEGLSFVLSNQQEKAVDLFLQIIQNSSSNNDYNEAFNARLTLGNLFRSRGDVQQAIKIHRELRIDPKASYEQKLLASAQIARDFINIGIYDRSEKIYLSLVNEPIFKQEALEMLCFIYERIKEWGKAIDVAEKLCKIEINLDKYKIKLANYYCEFASQLTDDQEIINIYKKALKKSKDSVRVSILLGDKLLSTNNYKQAISVYENILNQNPLYIGEIILNLKQCYMTLRKLDNYEKFILTIFKTIKSKKLELSFIEFFNEKYGQDQLKDFLYSTLPAKRSIYLFRQYLLLEIDNIEHNTRLRKSLTMLYDTINNKLDNSFIYYCNNCGYESNSLQWYCNACKDWETYIPNYEYKNIE